MNHLFSILSAVSIIGCSFPTEHPQTSSTLSCNVKTANANVINLDFLDDKTSKEQPYFHSIRPFERKAIRHSELQGADSLNAFIPNYPTKWIAAYNQVTISKITPSDSITFITKNNVLTANDRSFLESFQVGDKLEVIIYYQTENAITGELYDAEMNYTVGVFPDYDAMPTGDFTSLRNQLQDEFPELPSEDAAISFVINENGEVEQLDVLESFQDEDLTQQVKKRLSKLPKWTPAELENGTKVDQRFVWVYQLDGC
jgi:hypothetical protein